MINGYDIPEIAFYENKNVFTGCDGCEFRYRIARVDNDDGAKLEVSVWYEDLCFECCNLGAQEYFELSNDGLVDATNWLNDHRK